MEVRISVRNLVEFILRSGDIDNRKGAAADHAMAEGGRIHRLIQKSMGSNYKAEVTLRHIWNAGEYTIAVEGRADGILTESAGEGTLVTVDEIKGTYRELEKLKEPDGVHLAQAKCYAYIYALQNEIGHIRVRMTYCNMDTEQLRYFYESYDFPELEEWFDRVMGEYRKWSDFEFAWKEKRQASIQSLEFPFPYRNGQKELASYVYQTIYHKRKLFIEAPTGAGKTLSTVFPAVKSVGGGRGEKIFYLTAKTVTRTVAQEAFALLRERGLALKSVVLTAKEKICFMEEAQCSPDYCPYAKGHFDRVNEALYELITGRDDFGRDAVEACAREHQVCPFELCLDVSLFCDAVIGDYNYLFDPHVYLKRFFQEGTRGSYIFLVDEAHNLVERGRQMYSAALKKEDFLALKRLVKPVDARLEHHLEKCNKELLALKRECQDVSLLESAGSFTASLMRAHAAMEVFLEEHDDGDVRKAVLDLYFEVSHFLDISEGLDDNYVIYTQLTREGEFFIKLFCVNPGEKLRECMDRGISTILFSATFLPIQYYKGLLGGSEEDYEVYAESVFDPRRLALFIGGDVTSRYSRRSDMEYYNIAAYIHETVKNRRGNYFIFFPSHQFLRKVYDIYEAYFYREEEEECILQDERMDEAERETFLNRFREGEGREEQDIDFTGLIRMEIETEGEKSLLGFCVLGGIFSEGIDLKKDSLIGVIVVGTGLPQVCPEREIVKDYFEQRGGGGFDYAYRYPGMNKVLQAAGRVIRTAEDVGIIALLDDRFLQGSYRALFPREWRDIEVVTRERIAKRVERFWDEWL